MWNEQIGTETVESAGCWLFLQRYVWCFIETDQKFFPTFPPPFVCMWVWWGCGGPYVCLCVWCVWWVGLCVCGVFVMCVWWVGVCVVRVCVCGAGVMGRVCVCVVCVCGVCVCVWWGCGVFVMCVCVCVCVCVGQGGGGASGGRCLLCIRVTPMGRAHPQRCRSWPITGQPCMSDFTVLVPRLFSCFKVRERPTRRLGGYLTQCN